MVVKSLTFHEGSGVICHIRKPKKEIKWQPQHFPEGTVVLFDNFSRKGYNHNFAFTWHTVQELIDKINELSLEAAMKLL